MVLRKANENCKCESTVERKSKRYDQVIDIKT